MILKSDTFNGENMKNKQKYILGGIGITIMLVATSGTLFHWVTGFLKGEAYSESLKQIKTNEDVIELLGEPIKESIWVTGNLEENDDTGSARLQFSLSGPKSEADAQVSAIKMHGTWILLEVNVLPKHTNSVISVIYRNKKNLFSADTSHTGPNETVAENTETEEQPLKIQVSRTTVGMEFKIINKNENTVIFNSLAVEYLKDNKWKLIRPSVTCGCNSKCVNTPTFLQSEQSLSLVWNLKDNDCNYVISGVYRGVINDQYDRNKGGTINEEISPQFELKMDKINQRS